MDVTPELFLKYHFAEAKDLLKSFITLISATLVLSIAFAEKIVDFHNSNKIAKVFLFVCWTLLILALVIAGISICYLALSGGEALYGNRKLISDSVTSLSDRANNYALLSSVSYVG